MLKAKWLYLPLGGSLHRSRRDDTLRDAPHMVAHLDHWRGVADVQRDFDQLLNSRLCYIKRFKVDDDRFL